MRAAVEIAVLWRQRRRGRGGGGGGGGGDRGREEKAAAEEERDGDQSINMEELIDSNLGKENEKRPTR